MPTFVINYGLVLQGEIKIDADTEEDAKNTATSIIEGWVDVLETDEDDLQISRPTVVDDWIEANIDEEDIEEEEEE